MPRALDPHSLVDVGHVTQSGTAIAERIMNSVSSGLQYAERVGMEKDVHYVLFRAQDTTAWITFTVVFLLLIIFDNAVLHRSKKALSPMTAGIYVLFWVFCAFCFCGYIWMSRGSSSACDWMSGYLLEWMLSFDNLFVFHLIFQCYATPDDLKHKPLFWGICGAVFFRLLFLFIGEYMMHAMFFAHLLFGGFLVYTGAKAALWDDDDEEDPSKNPVVQWLSHKFPFVGVYDTKGSFFVSVPVNERGEPMVGNLVRSSDAEAEEEGQNYGAVDFDSEIRSQHLTSRRTKTFATMLFLVVVCLEVSDILFAVDSVSAIVAQVPDLFLAYTSAVFAMLGLRATFFIVDELVKLFSLLKYGISLVLIFIGIKLMLSKVLHIPPMVVCALLFSTLVLSMLASVFYEKYKADAEKRQPAAKSV